MPPKPKFTREEIVAAALEIVSEKGIEALTAKELGEKLGSSARPIFTVFSGMRELQGEVRETAICQLMQEDASLPQDMPSCKRFCMRLVNFGLRKPRLYQMLFMHNSKENGGCADVFGLLGTLEVLCGEELRREYGLAGTAAAQLFEQLRMYTFGVSTLCAMRVCRFSEERLEEMVSGELQALLAEYTGTAAGGYGGLQEGEE